jgi:AcrR family transcriptional regulator
MKVAADLITAPSPRHSSDTQASGTRHYRKHARAESERATGEAILDAALAAFTREPYDRVTLRSIAEQSGVSVQTVIRRFGSKEQLFGALIVREKPRILASRDVAPDASLDSAIAALVRHYETDGDLVLSLLAQEGLFTEVRHVVEHGRQVHREWVKRHCGDALAGRHGAEHQGALHAAIAATDLTTWKLLRRDLGLDEEEVVAVMLELVNGLRRNLSRSQR